MDWLSAIATCSLHGDVSLVIAMAMTFSGGNPYTVRNANEVVEETYVQDETLRLPMPVAPKGPKSRAEAEAKLRAIAEEGDGAPVVGLLPVPVAWAAQFARKPSDLVNPCINVSIATAKLSEFEYECGSKGSRECVLLAYAEAAGLDDLEQEVLDEIEAQALTKQGDAVIDTEQMLSAPLVSVTDAAEERGRQWGADRLFFVFPAEPAKARAAKSDSKPGEHEAAAPVPTAQAQKQASTIVGNRPLRHAQVH